MIKPQALEAIRLRDSRYRPSAVTQAPTGAEIPVNDRRDLLAALDETLATLAVAQAENTRLRDAVNERDLLRLKVNAIEPLLEDLWARLHKAEADRLRSDAEIDRLRAQVAYAWDEGRESFPADWRRTVSFFGPHGQQAPWINAQFRSANPYREALASDDDKAQE